MDDLPYLADKMSLLDIGQQQSTNGGGHHGGHGNHVTKINIENLSKGNNLKTFLNYDRKGRWQL
jgi:hypothetical protein